MNYFTKDELIKLSEKHGGLYVDDIYPHIEFDEGEYGIESTSSFEGVYGNFKFFGDIKKQKNILSLINELSEATNTEGQLLTTELAHSLVNKKVVCKYFDVNKGEISFKIISFRYDDKNKSIGQNGCYWLQTQSLDGITKSTKYFYKEKEFQPNNRFFIIKGKFTDFYKEKERAVGIYEYAIKHRVPASNGKIPIKEKFISKITDNPYLYELTWDDNTKEIVRKDTETLRKLFPNIINCWYCVNGDCPNVRVEEVDYVENIYEWQGIYRIGSGAERLFLIKILEEN